MRVGQSKAGGSCVENAVAEMEPRGFSSMEVPAGRRSIRQRRIGIVALARKLLVQLWKYRETGVPPAGAELTDWRTKAKVTTLSLKAR